MIMSPMKLLEVRKVYRRINYFELVGIDFKLAITNYHAFLTEDKRFVTAETINSGSKIWVDTSAFKSDGSLRFTRFEK